MIPVNDETRKTHKPSLQVRFSIKSYDRNGKLLDEKEGENSLLAGFAAYLAGILTYNDSTITEHDITNTLKYFAGNFSAVYNNYGGMTCFGAYNIQTNGIVLGTNNTAVTSDDYKLNTIIAAGSAGGQLIHLQQVNNAVVTSAPNSSMSMDRVFINHSGGTITVKELGFYTLGNGFTMCACRDIIADPGTDIVDGGYMFVRYTITVHT